MSRILIVSRGNLPSRAANSLQIYKTAKYMAELGHKVYLIVDHNCSEASIKDFYGTSKIKILNAFHFKNNPTLRRVTKYFYKQKINEYINNLNIDTIFTRDILLLPRLPNGKCVIWETHDSKFNEKVQKKIDEIENIKVVTISKELSNRIFINYKCKSKILYDACERIDFTLKKHVQKKVVFTGHLYEHRGIDQILRIAGQFPHVNFEIYGGLENDINYWKFENKNDNVLFKGFVDPKNIQSVQAQSGILIINYSKNLNTATYCSPLKLTEYISTGNIVLTSKFGPIVDEFMDYVCAFEADNDQALIDALQNVLSNYDELLDRQRAIVLKKPLLSWLERCQMILYDKDDK